MAGANLCGRIEFPDNMARIIDLGRRAKLAKRCRNAVLLVVHVDLGAEEPDPEGITAESNVAAFATDAGGFCGRDRVQDGLFQLVRGVKPPSRIEPDRHYDRETKPKDFSGCAGLA